MNFDDRDSHWESLLQDKMNISNSFSKESCCKICLCLELLKLSVCTDSCYRPQEEAELVNRLLSGIVDPDTFSAISEKLRSHLSTVSGIASFADKVSDLEHNLKKYTQNMIDLDISSHLEKLNKVERAPDSTKIDALVRRIDSYEETLENLKKENEELRICLNRAISLHEEFIQHSKRSSSEVKLEYEALREEQNKIRTSIGAITKSIADNSSALKEIKNIKENFKEDPEFRAMKTQIVEEQKEFVEKTQNWVKKLHESGLDQEKRIEKSWQIILDMKKEQETLKSMQKECIKVSRHSSHLLSASDSVYSSCQQLQDFNNFLEDKLLKIQKEIERKIPERKGSGLEDPRQIN